MPTFNSMSGVAAIIFMLAGGRLPAQELDEALVARFSKAVRGMETHLSDISVRVRSTIIAEQSPTTLGKDYSAGMIEKLRKQGKDPTRQAFSGEYAVRGNSVLQVKTSAKGIEQVMARNGNYAFTLARKEGIKDYSLQALEKLGVNRETDELVDERAETVHALVPGTWMMFGVPLSQWLSRDAFQIKQISEVDYEGEKLVRLDFQHLVEKIEPKRYSLSDAYLICDPNEHWALREYAATFVNAAGEGGRTYRVMIELEALPNGVPIATKTTSTMTWIDDPKSTDQTIKTLEIISRDVPEEIFHLRHYGLPEPNFGGSWFGTWGWYLFGGIGCIVVGAIMIKWRSTGR